MAVKHRQFDGTEVHLPSIGVGLFESDQLAGEGLAEVDMGVTPAEIPL